MSTRGGRAGAAWGGGLLGTFLGLVVTLAPGGVAATESDPLAASPTPVLGLTPPEIHGFVSQGYIRSISNNYLTRTDSSRGSFEFAELGINFTQPLSDNLRAGIQLFSRDLGALGNYAIKADWFYLDFRWADWLGVRAGRTKLPFGLYNESNDVDAARVPILLPQSTYPIGSRDYLLAQTGVELYGRLSSGSLGALDYRLYGGTIFLDRDSVTNPEGQVLQVGVPYIFGGRLLWETPLEGLRLGGSAQKLRIDAAGVQNGTPLEAKLPVTLWVASLEYAADALTLAVEYGRWHAERTTSIPDLVPRMVVDEERAYAMASLRVTDWLEPGAYYALYFPSIKDRTGTAAQLHDVALSLRFDLQAHWLFKLEGHYMVGTAGVSPLLNTTLAGATPLERNWGLFLAKTTAYF
ncbi:MAG: hypothetical protein RL685_5500 [Pseudomonadota bacterium]|jgi:hypothetical protein